MMETQLINTVNSDNTLHDVIFFNDSEEVLKICADGSFYVNGNLVAEDIEVYHGLVKFLKGVGCYGG